MQDLKLAFDGRRAVQDKAQAVIDKLAKMRLLEAADKIREAISGTPALNSFLVPYWHGSWRMDRWSGWCGRYAEGPCCRRARR